MGDSDFLRISRSAQARLIAAARDAEPERGLTHGYYKYPARFSPTFARAAIETLTKPGQLVFDPHVGGGTSLVEARALGREAVGVDISALAEFVARGRRETARNATPAADYRTALLSDSP